MDLFEYLTHMETVADEFIEKGGTEEDAEVAKAHLFKAIDDIKKEPPSPYECWNRVREQQINAIYACIGILDKKVMSMKGESNG